MCLICNIWTISGIIKLNQSTFYKKKQPLDRIQGSGSAGIAISTTMKSFVDVAMTPILHGHHQKVLLETWLQSNKSIWPTACENTWSYRCVTLWLHLRMYSWRYDDVNSLCTVAVWYDSKKCERGPTGSKKIENDPRKSWDDRGLDDTATSEALEKTHECDSKKLCTELAQICCQCLCAKQRNSEWLWGIHVREHVGSHI